jgi:hypothetical protein
VWRPERPGHAGGQHRAGQAGPRRRHRAGTINIRREFQQAGVNLAHWSDEQVLELGRRIAEAARPILGY